MKNDIPPVKVLLHAGIEIVQTIIGWGNLPLRKLAKELGINPVAFKDPNNLSRGIDDLCHKYAVFTLKEEFGDKLSSMAKKHLRLSHWLRLSGR